MGCLVERRGDHQCHWLTRVMNPVVLKWQIALSIRMQVTPRIWCRIHSRHVLMREHAQYAGRILGDAGVNRYCAAVRNRAVDDCGVHRARERNIGRVACAAGHLERAVAAGDRLSDGVHSRAPAICNARSATRWASSTLKELWASGRASVNEAVIADLRASMSSSDAPRSSVSAVVSRQGLCAPPPMASRAERMRLPSAATAAAAETSANS